MSSVAERATPTRVTNSILGPVLFASTKATIAIDVVAGGQLDILGKEMKAKIVIRQDLENAKKRKHFLHLCPVLAT